MIRPAIPKLLAIPVTFDDDIVRYQVWCDQCRDYHYHGPLDGPREARCTNPDSLYNWSGYIIRCESLSAEVTLPSGIRGGRGRGC